MAAPTQYYVDPAIAANSGAGTIGDPFGDVQYALNTVTRNATDGDQFNIKAGTDEILSSNLTLATYGTPSLAAQLIFRGYTSTAGDGGIGGFDLGANNITLIKAADGFQPLNVQFVDLHIHNSTINGAMVNLSSNCSVINCEFEKCVGALNTLRSEVHNCHFHDISGTALEINTNSRATGNYFKNDGTRTINIGVYISTGTCFTERNIFSLGGASNGIRVDDNYNYINNNSILSNSGTGTGIRSNGNLVVHFYGNLVEGFSGAGGKGIDGASTATFNAFIYANALYNNTTNYIYPANFVYIDGNESLGSSLFAKSGADTFANRATYFAPVDIGNVRTGGPHGQFKGAVAPAAGGASPPELIMINRSNSLLTR